MKSMIGVVAATLSIVSTAILAQDLTVSEPNDTMLELLIPGRKLVIESPDYRLEVTFFENGTYTTSNGSSGTWKMLGDRICTIKQAGVESCGQIPPRKRLNEQWFANDYRQRPVTVSVR